MNTKNIPAEQAEFLERFHELMNQRPQEIKCFCLLGSENNSDEIIEIFSSQINGSGYDIMDLFLQLFRKSPEFK